MDSHQKENWKKIKEYMEKNGCTDNDYYMRAAAIDRGGKDPVQELPPLKIKD
jgi:hypothetical protein